METSEIDDLIKAVIALRMNATKKNYGPTFKAVRRLNIAINYTLMDARMRKPVLSCLIGRKINSTKTLSAGEVWYLTDAIENEIPKGTINKLELAIGGFVSSYGKPEELLMWNDDHSGLRKYIANWWPQELPIGES